MPAVRIIRFDSYGDEVGVARLPNLRDALLFTRAAADRTAWLVLDTIPPVWLPAASVIDEPTIAGCVDRYYQIARENLREQGVSAAHVDIQLPLGRSDESAEGA